MLVAAGQFAVTPDWTENAQTCVSMMRQAAKRGQRFWFSRKRCWRETIAMRTYRLNPPSALMAAFYGSCWQRAKTTP